MWPLEVAVEEKNCSKLENLKILWEYSQRNVPTPEESSLFWRKDKQCSYQVGSVSKRFTLTVLEKKDCFALAAVLTLSKVKWIGMTTYEDNML